MATEIKLYTEDLIPSVKAFNCRLKAGGEEHQFPEHHVPEWLPKLEGRRIFREYFVAVEGSSEVRGAFILKHQDFSLAGETVSMAGYQLPISEGSVNKAYALMGLQIVMNALRRQPLLYALGFGTEQVPLAVMLKQLGWIFEVVPFFFLVNHPYRFFRSMPQLRSTPLKRALADLLAFSGVGWMAVRLANLLLPERTSSRPAAQAVVVDEFGDWANALWSTCKQDYALCAVRDRETLAILYPRKDPRFIRLRVSQDGKAIGWAVLLDTQMVSSRHFGDLRVGCVADCLALRENARQVIRAATRHLRSLGADLIISNQLDTAWGTALKECGFLRGPSNFILAVSRKLADRLQSFPEKVASIHINRGDGEGPSTLLSPTVEITNYEHEVA